MESYTIRASIFVDVPYSPPYSTGPSQWIFQSGENDLVVQNPIILHYNARSHTASAVTDLLRRWKWEILEHPQYSPDMNPSDYDLFAKVKEPLQGTLYNTRDVLIRAMGRSIRNINKDGPADVVRRLPNIWQKVIHKLYPCE